MDGRMDFLLLFVTPFRLQGTCARQSRQSGLVGQFGQCLWPGIYAQPPSCPAAFAFSFWYVFNIFFTHSKGMFFSLTVKMVKRRANQRIDNVDALDALDA